MSAQFLPNGDDRIFRLDINLDTEVMSGFKSRQSSLTRLEGGPWIVHRNCYGVASLDTRGMTASAVASAAQNSTDIICVIRLHKNSAELYIPTHSSAIYFTVDSGVMRLSNVPRALVDTKSYRLNTVYVLDALYSHPSRRLPFESLYSRVRRLPPGAHAKISRRGLRVDFDWLRNQEGVEGGREGGREELKTAFLETLQTLTEGRETHVFLSGGLDSATIVAGLKALETPFVAYHFSTNAKALENVNRQQKALGFNLVMMNFDKHHFDVSDVISRASQGTFLGGGGRPRPSMQLPVAESIIRTRGIALHGQNADALVTVHDHVIPLHPFSWVRGFKNSLWSSWSRFFLSDPVARIATGLGQRSSEGYVRGLIMSAHDSRTPDIERV